MNGQTRYRLARLNSDGTLDSTFFPDSGGSRTEVIALGLRSDGKFYATSWTLQRLEANGAWDTSFRFYEYGPIFNCIGVQEDGRPIVGWLFSTVQGRQFLGRFDNDGILDESFSGFVNGQVEAIAVQSDGRILIGGVFNSVNGAQHTGIARLLGDRPVLNTQFGAAGAVLLKWPAVYTNYVLQASSNLPSTNWFTITNPPVVVNNVCVMTNPITSGNQFFRLAKP